VVRVFLDASALAKRYVNEEGSDRVDDICARAAEVVVSVLAVPEIISTLCRVFREKRITEEEYGRVKDAFLQDVRDLTIIDLTPAVLADSLTLLELHPLRAMDALHVACASTAAPDLFVSFDERQVEAAGGIGIPVWKVEDAEPTAEEEGNTE